MAPRDEEQFDPLRHRVYRVEVTATYETYVVATSEDEAEEIAQNYEDEDRADAIGGAGAAFFVAELKAGSEAEGDPDDVTPHGATRWGRRELTVAAALKLIANPPPGGEPPPPVPPLERLSDLEWVRKASGDHDGSRPRFRGVARVGGDLVATDGYRLHIAPAGESREGHWDPETGEDIEAPFPQYAEIVPADPANVELVDLDLAGMWNVLESAAKAGAYVTIPTEMAYAHLDAGYLADALVGALGEGGPTVRLLVRESMDPLRLDFPDLSRKALVMPCRVAYPERRGDYCLADFLRRLEVEA